MRFPSLRRAFLPITLPLLIFVPGSARAHPIQILSANEQGVTLRLEVSAFTVGPPGPDGRSRLDAPGLDVASLPGRPQLPVAATLIAIPPGSEVSARIESAEIVEERSGVRLTIGAWPEFRDDGGRLGIVPTMERMEPIRDGPWPTSPVEVSEPFTVRRQRVITVRLHPFRYDESGERLLVHRALTVRVHFARTGVASGLAVPREDPHWEPVLKSTILNYEQGRSWRTGRSRAVPEGRSWFRSESGPGRATLAFDEDEPEVRVRLDTTGVYRIEFDRLRDHGYPTGVPLGEVSVHRHEFLEDAGPGEPPYATIELPIEVVDRDQDGLFGPGDQVLVFIQSWAERSRASWAQRAWGDGEVVYVTRLRGRNGLRLPTRPGWRSFSLSALQSYPWRQRWEKNLFYMPVFQIGHTDTNTDRFHWTEIGLFSRADSFRFETNHLDTSQAASFSITWQGRKFNRHFNWAHIRNGTGRITAVADSVEWFGRGARTETVTFNGSALTEGNTNVMRTWGKTSDQENQVVNTAVNYFDATYWRRYHALSGVLSCNSAGALGDFQIRAEGFPTPEIRVYDVTDSLGPVRLTIPDSLITREGAFYSVRFQDTSPSGALRSYVLFGTPRSLSADRYQPVTRRRLTQSSAGDYLLIAPEGFLPAVDPLVQLRESQGLRVVVAPLESVNDEFNGGRRSIHAVKRFIRHAYLHWDARFVLLVGDGSEDPQRFLRTPQGRPTAGVDYVPAPIVAGPVGVFDFSSTTNEAIVSDPWYVWCVDCPDPSRQPKIHDLFIGRLPVNSLQQTTDVVSKLVSYENVKPGETWRRQMVLNSDDRYSTTSFFGGGNPGDLSYCDRPWEDVFLDINRAVARVIADSAGLVLSTPEQFDLEFELRNVPRDPGNPDCRLSWDGTQTITRSSVSPRLIQKLNAGTLWWNFQGHANPSVLTHEDLYVNRGLDDDKDNLANNGMPFLFTAFACHPNSFGRVREAEISIGTSLGEDMVVLPGKGAVASWGSTGFEILPSNFATHLNVHLARALFNRRLLDERLGVWDGQVVLGEAVAKALLDNLKTTGFSLERDVGISYVLLGDPATRISMGTAQMIVTANGQPVTDGEPVRLFSIGDTLRIEADLATNSQFRSILLERTDGRGTRTIPAAEYSLTPPFPDTTSTSAGRRYRLSYSTRLDIGSYRYTIRTQDAGGAASSFDVVFRFLTILRSGGTPIVEGDPVSPDARLSLLVLSPGPIAQPLQDFEIRVNGQVQPFRAEPAHDDSTRREWVLSWDHAPYAPGEYEVQLAVLGEVTSILRFRVQSQMLLTNAMAFPNPFDDELGTHFSFYLEGDRPANVLVRVFTVSGRVVFEGRGRDLFPGYHQIPWDGRDAEGQKLANGVYLFRLVARGDDGSVMHEGRLVKLRRPQRRTTDLE